MPRLVKIVGSGKNRIPLSAFKEDIVVLRTASEPHATDESWVRNAFKVGEFQAVMESGVVKRVRGEQNQISSSAYWLFAFPKDEVYDFTLTDFVIHGKRVYKVDGYLDFKVGNREYYQLNTLPWGNLREGDFVVKDAAEVDAPPAIEPPNTANDFWDE